MIVPSRSLYSDDFYEKIFAPISEMSEPRKELFNGYSGPLEKHVTIVYLLQPDFIE